MRKLVLIMAALIAMGSVSAQTSKVIVGATTAKAISVTKGYKKSLQQIQDQLRFQVESQYRTQPSSIPILLSTIDIPKIPTIDTAKFGLHRFVISKVETLRLQKKAFDEQYRLPFPMETTISGALYHLHKTTK